MDHGLVLYQRDLGFDEELGDIESACHGCGRSALARAITGPIAQVRIIVHFLIAVFTTKNDLYSIFRHGADKPVIGQVTGYEGNVLVLVQTARSVQGYLQVVERSLRHAA